MAAVILRTLAIDIFTRFTNEKLRLTGVEHLLQVTQHSEDMLRQDSNSQVPLCSEPPLAKPSNQELNAEISEQNFTSHTGPGTPGIGRLRSHEANLRNL